MMLRSRAGWGVVLACIVTSCADSAENATTDERAGQEDSVTAEALRVCSTSRQLVCGRDGRTYTNVCRAGGWRNLAHFGACAGFVCSGTVCAAGFTCRTFTIYGVPVDQCVSDSGVAPSCSCPSGSHCVQDPSGATRCEADPPPPPPPDPSTLCQGKTCPTGLHCAVITIYGVPAASCMYD
jgi:hypothetical protein